MDESVEVASSASSPSSLDTVMAPCLFLSGRNCFSSSLSFWLILRSFSPSGCGQYGVKWFSQGSTFPGRRPLPQDCLLRPGGVMAVSLRPRAESPRFPSPGSSGGDWLGGSDHCPGCASAPGSQLPNGISRLDLAISSNCRWGP